MGKQTRWNIVGKLLVGISVLAIVPAYGVSADRFTSPSYTIDASVGNSFGGATSSSSYRLVSSGGEALIGDGTGGSYKLTEGYIAQLEKSLQLTVQPSGRVAYYPLDESIGTAVWDASANASNGSLVNGPTWTTGKINSALALDGVDDKVAVGTPSVLTGITTMTWSAWIYPTNVTKDQMFLSKQGSNYLRISNSQAFASFNDTGTQRTLSGTTALTNNQWYHVAATYEKPIMRLYVNGVKVAERTDIANNLDFNTGAFEIGQWLDADKRSFQGNIDEVKILNRALSPIEVKAEYDAGTAGSAAGLAFATEITAGSPLNVEAQAVIQTDAPGYNMLLNQNQNLTNGGNSIPVVNNGGTISAPAAWTTGTTKGFGFSLTGTNATALDSKWGTGANYAAVPVSATTFYSRSGYTAGAKDTLNIRYRLDVNSNQVAGTYTNTITYTGTMIP